jgi:phosphatidylserine/phosphatidylglycerophosphate/cardiolipin synthase-like enzyme
MAQILTTKGLAASLEDIIRNSKGEVHLISYSFRISKTFLRHIRNALNNGIKVRIVFGKFIYDDTQLDLESISNLEVYYCENLHAKVYANESRCIIGSMNFYEYSEINNIELGVLLTAKEDPEAFRDALRHCSEIFAEAKRTGNTQKRPKDTLPNGYCVRTGVKIPLNLDRPYCDEAHQIWSQYENRDFAENYCHFTGEPSNGQTSMNYPVLLKNWGLYVRAISKEQTF